MSQSYHNRLLFARHYTSISANERITTEREREVREHFGLESEDSASESDRGGSAPGYRDDSREDTGTDPETHGDESEASDSTEPGGDPEYSPGYDSTAQDEDRETVRVSVWREKPRAVRVRGEDGGEEVRIRKEWAEEEEVVEVEAGPREDDSP